MAAIYLENLILDKEIFERPYIENRLSEGGFNSIAKFEQFIWDLEMFLQFQRKLGDKTLLKGGAAAQFFIPINAQRTSIDIDMICTATRDELRKAISEIESELHNDAGFFRLKQYVPKNPKLDLDALETYYLKVPSICDLDELYTSKGTQEVKLEFLLTTEEYPIDKIKRPLLFACDTGREFNILSLECLFADKLTTLGPTTIGIPDDRADEQFKQLYDVITLFISNVDRIISGKEKIKSFYETISKTESRIHNIAYDPEALLHDMKSFYNRVKNIENDKVLLNRANDFQSLYLRKGVNRDKAQWAIVGFQLDLLVKYLFENSTLLRSFDVIAELSDKLKFSEIRGPERGQMVTEARSKLQAAFSKINGLSEDVFKKRLDRIIWEIASFVPVNMICDTVKSLVPQHNVIQNTGF